MVNNQASYKIKDRSATAVTVEVSIDPQLLKDRLGAIYDRYSREVSIPGFRKGHVPHSFLETRFGKEVFLQDAREQLQKEHLPKALAELELSPVSPPELKTISAEEDPSFVFEASLAVLPEFELPDYRGIELAVPPGDKVAEEDIEAALEETQRQHATLVPKDRKTVSEGDIVSVKAGEEEWDMRASRGHPVTSRLIGNDIGVTVEVDLPTSGENVVPAELTIVGIKEIELPEIDDELAKDAGYEDLAMLREGLTDEIEERGARQREQDIKVKLLDWVVRQTDLPLPQPLVDQVAAEEFTKFKQSFEHPGAATTFADYLEEEDKDEETMRTEYKRRAEKRLRRELVLRRIVEKEGLQIDDAGLDEIARKDAEGEGKDPLRFVAQLKADEHWEDFRRAKLNERVFSILYAEAKIKEGE